MRPQWACFLQVVSEYAVCVKGSRYQGASLPLSRLYLETVMLSSRVTAPVFVLLSRQINFSRVGTLVHQDRSSVVCQVGLCSAVVDWRRRSVETCVLVPCHGFSPLLAVASC